MARAGGEARNDAPRALRAPPCANCGDNLRVRRASPGQTTLSLSLSLSLSKSSHRTAPLGALSDFERSSRPTPRARARIQGAPENPRGRQAQCCRDIRSQHGLCELIEFNAHEACTGARGKRSRLRSSMVERECHKATMPDAADVRHASERTHQQRLRSASEIGSASYRQRRLLMAPAIRLKSCPDLRLRSATTSCTEEAGTVSTEPAFACFRVARSVGRCC